MRPLITPRSKFDKISSVLSEYSQELYDYKKTKVYNAMKWEVLCNSTKGVLYSSFSVNGVVSDYVLPRTWEVACA